MSPTGALDKNTLYITYYYIERLNGVLGKTHLQKMLFLTDLLSSKKFKEKLTTIDYKKYHFGPYSEAINDYVSFLKEKGYVEEKKFPFMDGSDRHYSRFYTKKPATVKNKLVESVGAEKTLLLDEVVTSYGNLSLQEVLDVVYSLEVVKGAEKNKPLDVAEKLESVDDEPRDVAF